MQQGNKIALEGERLAQLLSFNLKTNVTNSLLGIFAAYLLADVLPAPLVINWLVVLLVLNVLRFIVGHYYLLHPVKQLHLIQFRLNVFRTGLILSAIIWCLISFWVYGVEGEQYQYKAIVACLLLGLSAAAAMTYLIDLTSATAFIVFSIIPALIGLIMTQGLVVPGLIIMGFVYVLFMFFAIKDSNQRLIEGVKSRQEAIDNAQAIEKLAFYDLLTGLPNRGLLLEELELALVSSERTGKYGAFLFLDMDHFKLLNDSMGHDVGDELLKQAAGRLKESVRGSDIASRFAGDEFVVLLQNLSENYVSAKQEVELVVKKMQATLNQPYQLAGKEYQSTLSIGIAMFGEHGRTKKELLKHADIAMYAVKQSGRNNFQFFDETLRTKGQ